MKSEYFNQRKFPVFFPAISLLILVASLAVLVSGIPQKFLLRNLAVDRTLDSACVVSTCVGEGYKSSETIDCNQMFGRQAGCNSNPECRWDGNECVGKAHKIFPCSSFGDEYSCGHPDVGSHTGSCVWSCQKTATQLTAESQKLAQQSVASNTRGDLDPKACRAAGGEVGPVVVEKFRVGQADCDKRQCSDRCCFTSCQCTGTCGAEQPAYVPPPTENSSVPSLQGSPDCQTTAPNSAACAGDKAWGDCINRTGGDSVQCGFEADNAYLSKLDDLKKEARKSDNPALALAQLDQQTQYDNIETYLRRAAACKDQFGKPLPKSECLGASGQQVDLPSDPKELKKIVDKVYNNGQGCQQDQKDYAKCVAKEGKVAVADLKSGKLDKDLATKIGGKTDSIDIATSCTNAKNEATKAKKIIGRFLKFQDGTCVDCKGNSLDKSCSGYAVEQRSLILQSYQASCLASKTSLFIKGDGGECYSCGAKNIISCQKAGESVGEIACAGLVNGDIGTDSTPYQNCVARSVAEFVAGKSVTGYVPTGGVQSRKCTGTNTYQVTLGNKKTSNGTCLNGQVCSLGDCVTDLESERRQNVYGNAAQYCEKGFGGSAKSECLDKYTANIKQGYSVEENGTLTLTSELIKKTCAGSQETFSTGGYMYSCKENRKLTTSEQREIEKKQVQENQILAYCGRNRSEQGASSCYAQTKTLVDQGGKLDVNTGKITITVTNDLGGGREFTKTVVTELYSLAPEVVKAQQQCGDGYRGYALIGGQYYSCSSGAKLNPDRQEEIKTSIANATESCNNKRGNVQAISNCVGAKAAVVLNGGRVEKNGQMFDSTGKELVIEGEKIITKEFANFQTKEANERSLSQTICADRFLEAKDRENYSRCVAIVKNNYDSLVSNSNDLRYLKKAVAALETGGVVPSVVYGVPVRVQSKDLGSYCRTNPNGQAYVVSVHASKGAASSSTDYFQCDSLGQANPVPKEATVLLASQGVAERKNLDDLAKTDGYKKWAAENNNRPVEDYQKLQLAALARSKDFFLNAGAIRSGTDFGPGTEQIVVNQVARGELNAITGEKSVDDLTKIYLTAKSVLVGVFKIIGSDPVSQSVRDAQRDYAASITLTEVNRGLTEGNNPYFKTWIANNAGKSYAEFQAEQKKQYAAALKLEDQAVMGSLPGKDVANAVFSQESGGVAWLRQAALAGKVDVATLNSTLNALPEKHRRITTDVAGESVEWIDQTAIDDEASSLLLDTFNRTLTSDDETLLVQKIKASPAYQNWVAGRGEGQSVDVRDFEKDQVLALASIKWDLDNLFIGAGQSTPSFYAAITGSADYITAKKTLDNLDPIAKGLVWLNSIENGGYLAGQIVRDKAEVVLSNSNSSDWDKTVARFDVVRGITMQTAKPAGFVLAAGSLPLGVMASGGWAALSLPMLVPTTLQVGGTALGIYFTGDSLATTAKECSLHFETVDAEACARSALMTGFAAASTGLSLGAFRGLSAEVNAQSLVAKAAVRNVTQEQAILAVAKTAKPAPSGLAWWTQKGVQGLGTGVFTWNAVDTCQKAGVLSVDCGLSVAFAAVSAAHFTGIGQPKGIAESGKFSTVKATDVGVNAAQGITACAAVLKGQAPADQCASQIFGAGLSAGGYFVGNRRGTGSSNEDPFVKVERANTELREVENSKDGQTVQIGDKGVQISASNKPLYLEKARVQYRQALIEAGVAQAQIAAALTPISGNPESWTKSEKTLLEAQNAYRNLVDPTTGKARPYYIEGGKIVQITADVMLSARSKLIAASTLVTLERAILADNRSLFEKAKDRLSGVSEYESARRELEKVAKTSEVDSPEYAAALEKLNLAAKNLAANTASGVSNNTTNIAQSQLVAGVKVESGLEIRTDAENYQLKPGDQVFVQKSGEGLVEVKAGEAIQTGYERLLVRNNNGGVEIDTSLTSVKFKNPNSNQETSLISVLSVETIEKNAADLNAGLTALKAEFARENRSVEVIKNEKGQYELQAKNPVTADVQKAIAAVNSELRAFEKTNTEALKGNFIRGNQQGEGKNQVTPIIESLLVTTDTVSKGLVFAMDTGSGKTSVVIKAIAKINSLFSDTTLIILSKDADVAKFVADYEKSYPGASIAGIDKATSATDSKVLGAKIVVGTKDVVFESIKGGSEEFIAKIRDQTWVVDEAQNVLLAGLDYTVSNTQSVPLSQRLEGVTAIETFKAVKKGLQSLIDEAITARQNENPMVVKGKSGSVEFVDSAKETEFNTRLVKDLINDSKTSEAARAELQNVVLTDLEGNPKTGRALADSINDFVKRSQFDDPTIKAAQAELGRRVAALNSIKDVLSEVPGSDYDVTNNHVTPRDGGMDQQRQYQNDYDALAHETVGKDALNKMLNKNGGDAYIADLDGLTVSDSSISTNYPIFLQLAGKVVAFTGTPEPVKAQLEKFYGIKLKQGGAIQEEVAFDATKKEIIVSSQEKLSSGRLDLGTEVAEGNKVYVVASKAYSQTDIELKVRLENSTEDIAVVDPNGKFRILKVDGSVEIALGVDGKPMSESDFNAYLKKNYDDLGRKFVKIYAFGSHYGADFYSTSKDNFIVVADANSRMTDVLQGMGRDRCLNGGCGKLFIKIIGREGLTTTDQARVLFRGNEATGLKQDFAQGIAKLISNKPVEILDEVLAKGRSAGGVDAETIAKWRGEWQQTKGLNDQLGSVEITGRDFLLNDLNRAQKFLNDLRGRPEFDQLSQEAQAEFNRLVDKNEGYVDLALKDAGSPELSGKPLVASKTLGELKAAIEANVAKADIPEKMSQKGTLPTSQVVNLPQLVSEQNVARVAKTAENIPGVGRMVKALTGAWNIFTGGGNFGARARVVLPDDAPAVAQLAAAANNAIVTLQDQGTGGRNINLVAEKAEHTVSVGDRFVMDGGKIYEPKIGDVVWTQNSAGIWRIAGTVGSERPPVINGALDRKFKVYRNSDANFGEPVGEVAQVGVSVDGVAVVEPNASQGRTAPGADATAIMEAASNVFKALNGEIALSTDVVLNAFKLLAHTDSAIPEAERRENDFRPIAAAVVQRTIEPVLGAAGITLDVNSERGRTIVYAIADAGALIFSPFGEASKSPDITVNLRTKLLGMIASNLGLADALKSAQLAAEVMQAVGIPISDLTLPVAQKTVQDGVKEPGQNVAVSYFEDQTDTVLQEWLKIAKQKVRVVIGQNPGLSFEDRALISRGYVAAAVLEERHKTGKYLTGDLKDYPARIMGIYERAVGSAGGGISNSLTVAEIGQLAYKLNLYEGRLIALGSADESVKKLRDELIVRTNKFKGAKSRGDFGQKVVDQVFDSVQFGQAVGQIAQGRSFLSQEIPAQNAAQQQPNGSAIVVSNTQTLTSGEKLALEGKLPNGNKAIWLREGAVFESDGGFRLGLGNIQTRMSHPATQPLFDGDVYIETRNDDSTHVRFGVSVPPDIESDARKAEIQGNDYVEFVGSRLGWINDNGEWIIPKDQIVVLTAREYAILMSGPNKVPKFVGQPLVAETKPVQTSQPKQAPEAVVPAAVKTSTLKASERSAIVQNMAAEIVRQMTNVVNERAEVAFENAKKKDLKLTEGFAKQAVSLKTLTIIDDQWGKEGGDDKLLFDVLGRLTNQRRTNPALAGLSGAQMREIANEITAKVRRTEIYILGGQQNRVQTYGGFLGVGKKVAGKLGPKATPPLLYSGFNPFALVQDAIATIRYRVLSGAGEAPKTTKTESQTDQRVTPKIVPPQAVAPQSTEATPRAVEEQLTNSPDAGNQQTDSGFADSKASLQAAKQGAVVVDKQNEQIESAVELASKVATGKQVLSAESATVLFQALSTLIRGQGTYSLEQRQERQTAIATSLAYGLGQIILNAKIEFDPAAQAGKEIVEAFLKYGKAISENNPDPQVAEILISAYRREVFVAVVNNLGLGGSIDGVKLAGKILGSVGIDVSGLVQKAVLRLQPTTYGGQLKPGGKVGKFNADEKLENGVVVSKGNPIMLEGDWEQKVMVYPRSAPEGIIWTVERWEQSEVAVNGNPISGDTKGQELNRAGKTATVEVRMGTRVAKLTVGADAKFVTVAAVDGDIGVGLLRQQAAEQTVAVVGDGTETARQTWNRLNGDSNFQQKIAKANQEFATRGIDVDSAETVALQEEAVKFALRLSKVSKFADLTDLDKKILNVVNSRLRAAKLPPIGVQTIAKVGIAEFVPDIYQMMVRSNNAEKMLPQGTRQAVAKAQADIDAYEQKKGIGASDVPKLALDKWIPFTVGTAKLVNPDAAKSGGFFLQGTGQIILPEQGYRTAQDLVRGVVEEAMHEGQSQNPTYFNSASQQNVTLTEAAVRYWIKQIGLEPAGYETFDSRYINAFNRLINNFGPAYFKQLYVWSRTGNWDLVRNTYDAKNGVGSFDRDFSDVSDRSYLIEIGMISEQNPVSVSLNSSTEVEKRIAQMLRVDGSHSVFASGAKAGVTILPSNAALGTDEKIAAQTVWTANGRLKTGDVIRVVNAAGKIEEWNFVSDFANNDNRFVNATSGESVIPTSISGQRILAYGVVVRPVASRPSQPSRPEAVFYEQLRNVRNDSRLIQYVSNFTSDVQVKNNYTNELNRTNDQREAGKLIFNTNMWSYLIQLSDSNGISSLQKLLAWIQLEKQATDLYPGYANFQATFKAVYYFVDGSGQGHYGFKSGDDLLYFKETRGIETVANFETALPEWVEIPVLENSAPVRRVQRAAPVVQNQQVANQKTANQLTEDLTRKYGREITEALNKAVYAMQGTKVVNKNQAKKEVETKARQELDANWFSAGDSSGPWTKVGVKAYDDAKGAGFDSATAIKIGQEVQKRLINAKKDFISGQARRVDVKTVDVSLGGGTVQMSEGTQGYHVGPGYPDGQDSVSIGRHSMAVADGVTNSVSGGLLNAQAARLAASQIVTELDRLVLAGNSANQIGGKMYEFLRRLDAQLNGNTTLLAVTVTNEGELVTIRVGDPEARLIRDGQVWELDEPLSVDFKKMDFDHLTPEQSFLIRDQSVNPAKYQGGQKRANGEMPVMLGPGSGFVGGSIKTYSLKPGDKIVLGSDAFRKTGSMFDQNISRIATQNDNPEKMVEAILSTVSNVTDDRSAAVMFYGSSGRKQENQIVIGQAAPVPAKIGSARGNVVFGGFSPVGFLAIGGVNLIPGAQIVTAPIAATFIVRGITAVLDQVETPWQGINDFFGRLHQAAINVSDPLLNLAPLVNQTIRDLWIRITNQRIQDQQNGRALKIKLQITPDLAKNSNLTGLSVGSQQTAPKILLNESGIDRFKNIVTQLKDELSGVVINNQNYADLVDQKVQEGGIYGLNVWIKGRVKFFRNVDEEPTAAFVEKKSKELDQLIDDPQYRGEIESSTIAIKQKLEIKTETPAYPWQVKDSGPIDPKTASDYLASLPYSPLFETYQNLRQWLTLEDLGTKEIPLENIIDGQSIQNWGDLRRANGSDTSKVDDNFKRMVDLAEKIRDGQLKLDDLSSPIALIELNGIYYVDADGTNRVAAAKLLGLKTIRAKVQRPAGEANSAPWLKAPEAEQFRLHQSWDSAYSAIKSGPKKFELKTKPVVGSQPQNNHNLGGLKVRPQNAGGDQKQVGDFNRLGQSGKEVSNVAKKSTSENSGQIGGKNDQLSNLSFWISRFSFNLLNEIYSPTSLTSSPLGQTVLLSWFNTTLSLDSINPALPGAGSVARLLAVAVPVSFVNRVVIPINNIFYGKIRFTPEKIITPVSDFQQKIRLAEKTAWAPFTIVTSAILNTVSDYRALSRPNNLIEAWLPDGGVMSMGVYDGNLSVLEKRVIQQSLPPGTKIVIGDGRSRLLAYNFDGVDLIKQKIYYHYTNPESAKKIVAEGKFKIVGQSVAQQIKATAGQSHNPLSYLLAFARARNLEGVGIYLTDLPPSEAQPSSSNVVSAFVNGIRTLLGFKNNVIGVSEGNLKNYFVVFVDPNKDTVNLKPTWQALLGGAHEAILDAAEVSLNDNRVFTLGPFENVNPSLPAEKQLARAFVERSARLKKISPVEQNQNQHSGGVKGRGLVETVAQKVIEVDADLHGVSEIAVPNENYKPYSDLVKEAVIEAEREDPNLNVYWSRNDLFVSFKHFLSYYSTPGKFLDLLDSLLHRGYGTISFVLPEPVRMLVDAVSTGYMGDTLAMRYGLDWRKIHVDEFKLAQEFVEREFEKTGRPVSWSLVIKYFLVRDKGDLALALSDAANFIEYESRNQGVRRYEWIKKHFLDEASPVGSFNNLDTTEIPYIGWFDSLSDLTMRIAGTRIGPAVYYQDARLETRIGVLYHRARIASLPSVFSRYLINLFTLFEYYRYGTNHGAVKFLSDWRGLQDLTELEKYFQTFEQTQIETGGATRDFDGGSRGLQVQTNFPAAKIIQTVVPIEPGEVFDGPAELRKIANLAASQKKQAMVGFRQKLAYQLDGLSLAQQEIVSQVRQNPEMGLADIMVLFDKWGKVYGFSPAQRVEAENLAKRYEFQHLRVESLKVDYPDDRELFKALFGNYPQGAVRTRLLPTVLAFEMDNPQDFVFASRGGANEHDAGFSIRSSTLLSNTDNSIILVNLGAVSNIFTPEVIISHEEQHLVNDFFGLDGLEMPKREGYVESFNKAIAPNATDDDKLLFMRQFVGQYYNDIILEHSKNELLAMLAGFEKGTVSEQVAREGTLTALIGDPSYDYWLGRRESITRYFSKVLAGADASLIAQVSASIPDSVLDDGAYHKTLADAIGAFFDLKEKGYSYDRAFALLKDQPFSVWPKVVERVLGGQDGKASFGQTIKNEADDSFKIDTMQNQHLTMKPVVGQNEGGVRVLDQDLGRIGNGPAYVSNVVARGVRAVVGNQVDAGQVRAWQSLISPAASVVARTVFPAAAPVVSLTEAFGEAADRILADVVKLASENGLEILQDRNAVPEAPELLPMAAGDVQGIRFVQDVPLTELEKGTIFNLLVPKPFLALVRKDPQVLEKLQRGELVRVPVGQGSNAAHPFKIKISHPTVETTTLIKEITSYFVSNPNSGFILRYQDGSLVGYLTGSEKTQLRQVLADLQVVLNSVKDRAQVTMLVSSTPENEFLVTPSWIREAATSEGLTNVSWIMKDVISDPEAKSGDVVWVTPEGKEQKKQDFDPELGPERTFLAPKGKVPEGASPVLKVAKVLTDEQSLADAQTRVEQSFNATSELEGEEIKLDSGLVGQIVNVLIPTGFIAKHVGVSRAVQQIKEKSYVETTIPGGVAVVSIDYSGFSKLKAAGFEPKKFMVPIFDHILSKLKADPKFSDLVDFKADTISWTAGDEFNLVIALNGKDASLQREIIEEINQAVAQAFVSHLEDFPAGEFFKGPTEKDLGIKMTGFVVSKPVHLAFYNGGILFLDKSAFHVDDEELVQIAKHGGNSGAVLIENLNGERSTVVLKQPTLLELRFREILNLLRSENPQLATRVENMSDEIDLYVNSKKFEDLNEVLNGIGNNNIAAGKILFALDVLEKEGIGTAPIVSKIESGYSRETGDWLVGLWETAHQREIDYRALTTDQRSALFVLGQLRTYLLEALLETGKQQELGAMGAVSP